MKQFSHGQPHIPPGQTEQTLMQPYISDCVELPKGSSLSIAELSRFGVWTWNGRHYECTARGNDLELLRRQYNVPADQVFVTIPICQVLIGHRIRTYARNGVGIARFCSGKEALRFFAPAGVSTRRH